VEGPLRPLILAAAVCATAVAAYAHHGAAAYDTTREVTVSGRVREWRWSQPHTSIRLEVSGQAGMIVWEGEGPPLSWARQRGWSALMLRHGDELTLVMYPSRSNGPSGLVKRIVRRSGEVIPVDRPWLDRENERR
jgi:hypothetical protein